MERRDNGRGPYYERAHTSKDYKNAGYTPIRIMFYYPNRDQAIRIQRTLQTLYEGLGGRYYFGESAWDYIKTVTGADLKAILETIADENAKRNAN